MKALKVIIILVVLLVCVAGIFWISMRVKQTVDTDRLLKTGKRSPGLVRQLLRINFGAGNMLTNVRIPFNPDKTSLSIPADTIIVVRGAIAVVHVLNLKGYIDNPYKGDWVQYNKGTVTCIRNPFEKYDGYISAVRTIMRREEVYNIPIYNVVVYTDPNVKLKNREESLVKIEHIIPFLKDMQKDKFTNSSEINNIMKVLHRYCKKVPSNGRAQAKMLPSAGTVMVNTKQTRPHEEYMLK